MVRQHVAKLIRTLGRPLVEDALDQLRPDDGEAIRQVSLLGWVPVDAMSELYDHVARSANRDVTSLHWEIGRECTADTLKTLWRVLMRLTSDEALVMRTPIIYSKTYNKGRLTAKLTGPKTARLTLTDWPGVPPFVRRGLCIGITTVLELAGRRDVHVEQYATHDGATFLVNWTP